ncbi:hypothetical protein Tcan_17941 [Toxocara canis]|uniref:Uncharacterized protein n=1 Tax=Toxocara canis TaxID=6265 RepID=A0A0B2VRB1_TOXCA|nr:hypothetical protein Tcan_17941 [Toxocara canis]
MKSSSHSFEDSDTRHVYTFSTQSNERTRSSPETVSFAATQKGDWSQSALNEDFNTAQNQFGELSHKNTWSRTYRKIFREFLEDERPIDYEEFQRDEILDLVVEAPPPNDPFSHTLQRSDELSQLAVKASNEQQAKVAPIEILIEEERPFVGGNDIFNGSEHNCSYSTRNVTRNLMLHEEQYAEIERISRKSRKGVVEDETTAAEPPAPPPPPPPPPLLRPMTNFASAYKSAHIDGMDSMKSVQQCIGSAEDWTGESKRDRKERRVSYGTTTSFGEEQRNENKNLLRSKQMQSTEQVRPEAAFNDEMDFERHPEAARDYGDVVHERLPIVPSPNEITERRGTTKTIRDPGLMVECSDHEHSRQSSNAYMQTFSDNVSQQPSYTSSSAPHGALRDQAGAKESLQYSKSYIDKEFDSTAQSHGHNNVTEEVNFDSLHKYQTNLSPPRFVEAAVHRTGSPFETQQVSQKQMVSKRTETDMLRNYPLSSKENYVDKNCSNQNDEYGHVSSLVKMFERCDKRTNLTEISQTHLKVNKQLGNFVDTYFGNNRPLTVKVLAESDIPLQHYWNVKARIKNNEKDADVTLEQLLTFVPGHQQQSQFSLREPVIPVDFPKYYGSGCHINKNTYANEKMIECSGQWNRQRNADLMKSAKNAHTLEGDLSMIYERIKKNLPLDRNELYALKRAHCRLVVPRENQLRKLKRESLIVTDDGSTSYGNNETIVRRMEAELLDDYERYEKLLDTIRVANHPYTQLALLIMRADAAWYTAKMTRDALKRRQQYSLAKKRYNELFAKATETLAANDTSLLKILEKLSTILAEYPDQHDCHLRNRCLQALKDAQQAVRTIDDGEETALMLQNIKEMLQCCDLFY